MRFKRLPRGGASPVISRKTPSSRFTHAQREVIEETMKGLYKLGKLPRHADIRVNCLAALRKKRPGWKHRFKRFGNLEGKGEDWFVDTQKASHKASEKKALKKAILEKY